MSVSTFQTMSFMEEQKPFRAAASNRDLWQPLHISISFTFSPSLPFGICKPAAQKLNYVNDSSCFCRAVVRCLPFSGRAACLSQHKNRGTALTQWTQLASLGISWSLRCWWLGWRLKTSSVWPGGPSWHPWRRSWKPSRTRPPSWAPTHRPRCPSPAGDERACRN